MTIPLKYSHYKSYGKRKLTLTPDRPYEIAPLPLSNGRIGCGWCNKTMASMEVLETHNEAIHQSHRKAACTECTWTKDGRPSDLIDHLRVVHDIYRAGHPNAFSADDAHIRRKTLPLLKRLLVEDRATLASLRSVPPPPATVPRGWNRARIAVEISRTRLAIQQLPGWQVLVYRKRAKRIAQ